MTKHWVLPANPILPNGILEETSGFLSGLESALTAAEIVEQVLRYVQPFGATNILVGTMPQPGATKRQQLGHILLNAWPNEWAARYFVKDYLFRDPTIQMVRRRQSGFLWDEIDNKGIIDPASRRIMAEAGDFGLKQGFTLTLTGLENEPVGFSIAGERLDLSPEDKRRLWLVASFATYRAIRLRDLAQTSAVVGISVRERQVAEFAACGLKEWQIAERMGITTHGVDKHMRSLREKLSAKNTTEAVVKAMRLGLIE